MPIDLQNHQLVSFAELAKSLPSRRGGRPVHASTISRWRSRGVCGVRLEAIKAGGSWLTSREAFADFCERVTAAETNGHPESLSSVATRRETAAQRLEASGW